MRVATAVVYFRPRSAPPISLLNLLSPRLTAGPRNQRSTTTCRSRISLTPTGHITSSPLTPKATSVPMTPAAEWTCN